MCVPYFADKNVIYWTHTVLQSITLSPDTVYKSAD